MAQTLIIDTETHKLHGAPIEIAHMQCSFQDGVLFTCEKEFVYDEYFSCDEPISLGAMAVHHILDCDIEHKPHFKTFRLPAGTTHLIGHNIDYDIRAIKECDPTINVKAICTLALSRMAWPELDSHSLSALYYFINSDKHGARKHLRKAHNAKADIYFTSVVLQAICEKLAIKDLVSLYILSETARIPTVMPFGKHRGEVISELSPSYLNWIINESDSDQYLKKAASKALGA